MAITPYYLKEHEEINNVLLSGGDAQTVSTAELSEESIEAVQRLQRAGLVVNNQGWLDDEDSEDQLPGQQ